MSVFIVAGLLNIAFIMDRLFRCMMFANQTLTSKNGILLTDLNVLHSSLKLKFNSNSNSNSTIKI